jgi:nitroreductase
MKRTFIIIISLFILCAFGRAQAQDLKSIKLNKTNMKRGSSLMEALSAKASVQGWSDKELSMQDLSDLLWAAAGINRPDNKKRTYSSAQNAQDVDIFVFLKDGVYIYDAANHALNPVLSGDHRGDIASSFGGGGTAGPGATPGAREGGAPSGPGETARGGGESGPPAGARAQGQSNFPVNILLVSDTSKFRSGPDDLKSEWGAISAGIITQNIMLFCAANGLGTHPRAMFDKAVLRTLLNLKDTQNPILELPVGHPPQ